MPDAAPSAEIATFRAERMSVDQLLAQYGRLRNDLAKTKQENRTAVTRRRQERKLCEIDVQAQDRWDDFTRQKHEMLRCSHTAQAPWTVIRSNNKHRARLNAMKVILNCVPYERKNLELDYAPDPEIVISGARELEIMEAQMLREGRFTV